MSEAINFTAIIMSTITLVTSLVSIVLVLAQKWSTHKIEWKPLTEFVEKEEIQTEEDSDEEILEKALLLQKAGKKSKYIDPLADIESTNF